MKATGPEFRMKINEKLSLIYSDRASKILMPADLCTALVDDNHFNSLIFTWWASPPEADKPEASICCVIQDEA